MSKIIAPELDLWLLAPFLIVTAGAIIALFLDLVLPPERQSVIGYFSLATVVVAIAACIPLWGTDRLGFATLVRVDNFGLFFTILACGATGLSLLLAIDYIRQQEIPFREYYPLILLTLAGMLMLIVANDLIMLFIGLEVLSIGLYILAGFARGNRRSEESAIKYFLLGSFSLGFLVYGASLVYGATGTTNYATLFNLLGQGELLTNPLLLAGVALVLVGFGFKLALVPFHSWTPDVYTGAPTSVTAFMSVGTKVATFAALLRLVVTGVPELRHDWATVLWALAIVTMIVGNVAAVTQRNIKRMLAYSSIGQAGYILVAVVATDNALTRNDATMAMLFYLLAYTMMNLGAFAVVIALGQVGDERLDLATDYAGLAQSHPILAGLLALFMLSLGGIPPTAGFLGKVLLFRAAVEAGYWHLALVGVITSMIALAYYLRVIIGMYVGTPLLETPDTRQRVPGPLAVVLVICVVLTLQLGILPALSLDFAQRALLGQ